MTVYQCPFEVEARGEKRRRREEEKKENCPLKFYRWEKRLLEVHTKERISLFGDRTGRLEENERNYEHLVNKSW